MTKPMIQIALDQTNLPAAIEVANNVESFVDVIERSEERRVGKECRL